MGKRRTKHIIDKINRLFPEMKIAEAINWELPVPDNIYENMVDLKNQEIYSAMRHFNSLGVHIIYVYKNSNQRVNLILFDTEKYFPIRVQQFFKNNFFYEKDNSEFDDNNFLDLRDFYLTVSDTVTKPFINNYRVAHDQRFNY